MLVRDLYGDPEAGWLDLTPVSEITYRRSVEALCRARLAEKDAGGARLTVAGRQLYEAYLEASRHPLPDLIIEAAE